MTAKLNNVNPHASLTEKFTKLVNRWPAARIAGGAFVVSLDAHRVFILEQIEEIPHLTLHRLKDLLAEKGVCVSHDTVWRFLRREDRSFKKTLFATEQHRQDVVRRRERWR